MSNHYTTSILTKLLLCLLFVGIANSVWGSKTWSGSNSITVSTSSYFTLGSTTVSLKGTGLSYDGTYKGIKNTAQKNAFLKATAKDGFVAIRFQGGTPNTPLTITGDGVDISTKVAQRNSTANAGTEVTFFMKKDAEYTIYSTGLLEIKRVIFYDTEGTDYIVLDETASNTENQAKATQAYGVTNHIVTKRTLKAGQWNTFCLPMTLSTDLFKIYMKCDYVYVLKEYNPYNNTISFEPFKKTDTNLGFYATCMPCLVKPTEDMVNPVFVGQYSSDLRYDASAITASSNGLKFTGVIGYENIYTTGDEDATKFYIDNEGYLLYPTSNEGNKGTIKGLRAYFEFDNPPAAGVQGTTLFFDESGTTGISHFEHDVLLDDNRVFSLDGRYVGTTRDDLPRGIYIQNGSKFVVK